MVWKTTDGFHVPQQSYPQFVTSVLKIFMCLIFVVVGHRQNIFKDEIFLIYGIVILMQPQSNFTYNFRDLGWIRCKVTN